jgi:hypothetical protein
MAAVPEWLRHLTILQACTWQALPECGHDGPDPVAPHAASLGEACFPQRRGVPGQRRGELRRVGFAAEPLVPLGDQRREHRIGGRSLPPALPVQLSFRKDRLRLVGLALQSLDQPVSTAS